MRRPLILVVEHQAPTGDSVAADLEAGGYEVVTAADRQQALELLGEQIVDLVILDLPPGQEGLALLDAIRRDLDVPVIVLSARGREEDKVEALDQGADDCLTRPFGLQELLARVRAALRRAEAAPRGRLSPYRHGDLEVDFGARRARLGGSEVALTPVEYGLLAYLARNAGKVRSHRQILQAVWGPRYSDEVDYVWTYVRHLRRKLEPDRKRPRYLLNEPGFGYRMPPAD